MLRTPYGGDRAARRAQRRARIRRRRLGALAILCALGIGCYFLFQVVAGAPARSGSSLGLPTSSPSSVRGVPTTTTPTSVPSQAQDPLGSAVTAYLKGRTDTVAVAVKDLATGQTWTTGPSTPQAEASVVKVEILADLLWHEPTGDSIPTATQADAQRMIEESTDTAATELWNAAGGATGLGGFDSAAGLTSTTPSSCLTCSGFAWPGWGLSKTTPSDQLTLLTDLVDPNNLLSTAQRNYELSLMEHVTSSQAWGVSSGVPSGVTIALKNGWVPLQGTSDWQINSIGWIDGAGHDYLIAVMTTGNSTMDYGVDTIDQVGSDVYEALGS